MVVYPAEKIDGSVEFLIATREGIKPNIIAQIRQNAMYAFFKHENGKKTPDYQKRDEFYEKLNNYAEEHTVDELLNNPEFSKYVNPTYTSGGSKEQMIIRKMKNNALKNYPKEYNTSYIRDAVESMYEDRDETVMEKPKGYITPNVVDKVEKEINEVTDEEAVQDFTVDEDGVVEKETTETETTQEETKEDYGF